MNVTSVMILLQLKNKLKHHEKLKHKKVKYACNKCYGSLTTQNKLKNHEKTSSATACRKDRDGIQPGGLGAFGVATCSAGRKEG